MGLIDLMGIIETELRSVFMIDYLFVYFQSELDACLSMVMTRVKGFL